jgi:hypothetical protein
MEPTPTIWSGSQPLPDYPPAQLTVRFEVVEERKGGCRVTFSVLEGSDLLTRHGTKGRALAACRDIIVDDLDVLVREFADEE